MSARTWLLAALVVVGLALATIVLASEKDEELGAPEPAVVRAPEGEWIRSVSGQRAEIWAVGDADPPASARIARLIRRADPDRILYLGDVYPTGTAADFDRWAKPWRNLIRRMAPTAGNHEWPNASQGYDPFWREVRGDPPPSYYSFKAGGWEILSVNSEPEDWQPAVKWLTEQTKPGGNCRVGFWHRPRYSGGLHEEGERQSPTEFWEALEGRARIIVNGHDHNSQRMRAQDGIVELIAGAGGRRLYDVDESYGRLAFSNDTDFVALRLDLSPRRARWRFVTVGGTVLDSGKLRCRA
jgi:hypothetical protein